MKQQTEVIPSLESVVNGEVHDDSMVDKKLLNALVPEAKDVPPSRTDVNWSDFIMSQFDKSEIFKSGSQQYPKNHGLRRLAQKYVGEIVESGCHCVSAPKVLENNGIDFACFVYTVKFQKPELDHRGNPQYVVYSDAADVYYAGRDSNNSDPAYAKFPTALAVTRAASRCLRFALGLNVCSAEELAPPIEGNVLGRDREVKERVVEPETEVKQSMEVGQKHFINTNCMRIDIHPWRLINSGKEKYTAIKDVPFEWAKNLCSLLGEMGRSKNNIDNAIRLNKDLPPEKQKAIPVDIIEKYSKDNNVDLGKYSRTWESEVQ